MKRVYKTTTINPGGSRIWVRQVLFYGNSAIPQQVAIAVQAARNWLSQTIPELRHDMAPNIASSYQHCFRAAPTPEDISTVKSVLTTVFNKLSDDFGIKVREDDEAYGYVRRYMSGRVHFDSGVQFYTALGNPIARRGEIHIDRNTLLHSPRMSVVTLIHEASHKFANLRDHGDRGYFEADYSDYEAAGLTHEEALMNADSYAVFCYFAHIAAERRAHREALDQIDNLEGVAELFS